MISLKSAHIQLDKNIVKKVFDSIQFAYVTYLAEQKRLLITPVSSQWFVKMYKPSQFLLKDKNINGDKTIAIREILIDHDVNPGDRKLDFEVVEKTNLIKISL